MATKGAFDRPDPPEANQAGDEQHRVEGFHALLVDHQNSGHAFEETDGSWRQWRELSARGRLSSITADAAWYEVPFESFAAAVRDVLSGQPAAVREEAALGLLYSYARELHGLAQMLPDYPGTNFPPPLTERFEHLLEWYEDRVT